VVAHLSSLLGLGITAVAIPRCRVKLPGILSSGTVKGQAGPIAEACRLGVVEAALGSAAAVAVGVLARAGLRRS
jgi:hypothetical protein